MPRNAITGALIAEAAALARVVTGLTGADLGRPSPCPPWTVGELLCHVLIATDRVAQAMAGPAPLASAPIAGTAEYYRPDERFSASANADRIETARSLASRLTGAGGPELAAELQRRCEAAAELLAAAAPDRTIRTRHGDRMLLTDFARTRVVELGLHGLDVAIGLDDAPWLTDRAAAILLDLLLPVGNAADVAAELGWDRVDLIARLTGRTALSSADAARLAGLGLTRLALG